MIKHLEKLEDFDELIKQNRVLVDFYAEWCGPCKMLMPLIEELDKSEDILVVKVDVDSFGEIAQKFRIMAVPTLLYFKDGNLLNRQSGYMPLNHLKEFVSKS